MIVANVDGGARGNPGSAGWGAIIKDEDGQVLAELYDGIGINTNNVAEYRGLIAALEWALSHGHKRLHVRSDSQLIVQQMLGNYRVKHQGLIPLHEQARRLAAAIGQVTFEHVRREQNQEADRLSNLGMDLNQAPRPRPQPLGPNGPKPQPSGEKSENAGWTTRRSRPTRDA